MLLLDAEKGIAAQDLSIFAMAVKKGKGIVVLVNKWDVMPKETNTARDYEAELKNDSLLLLIFRSCLFLLRKRQGYLKQWNWRWKYTTTVSKKFQLQS
jgi:predicted GTPase